MVSISRLGKTNMIVALVAVLVVGGGAYYLLHHKKTETIKVTSSRSANSENSSKKASQDNSSNTTSTSNSANNSQDLAKNTPPTTAKLEKPYGTFVSNHSPNLDGSPAPSTEQSVCNTAPGATCYIEFIKGTIVKKLPAERADSSGIVEWNWDVKQAGLTTGSWTIQAVASLNGKTMTAQDDLKLEVQP